MASPLPYISVIFCNRNDGYGGEQSERIEAFIRYFEYWDKIYPGLMEFVLCDWNPPTTRKSLIEGFSWHKLANVRSFVVSPDVHKSIGGNDRRPMLDYIGRNVAIRRAEAPYILVINQDIFPSSAVMHYLGKRALSERYFYRADRVDFDFGDGSSLAGEEIEQWASNHPICRHVRPHEEASEIHVPVNAENYRTSGTEPLKGEVIAVGSNLLFGSGLGRLRRLEAVRLWLFNRHLFHGAGALGDRFGDLGRIHANYWQRYLLHTNASGDFFLAPRVAFDKINGFPESTEFYMHTDGYACVAMFMAGYDQACFLGDAVAFHADHDRSDREGRPESMSYREHVEVFCEICRKERPYKLNKDNWGLWDKEIDAQAL